MAVTRINNSGIRTGSKKSDSFLAGQGSLPSVPTIGTATAGTGSATVAFTPGGIVGTTYRAISSPGGLTGTSSSSPITVSGLSNGTAYTFQVRAENAVGNSEYSAASNSVTPVVPLVVTGGTLTSDATYYYRRFTSSGTLGISGGTLTFDVVRVAGGGSGGTAQYITRAGIANYGGGGGAGGRLLDSNVSASTDRTIVIGAGANWPSTVPATGLQGSATTFTGLTSTTGGGGGGAGNSDSTRNGVSGGSGGGGGSFYDTNTLEGGEGPGGAGTSGQGNSGASGSRGSYGGGGGGSSAAGSTSSGGAGTTTWNWTTSAGGTGSTVGTRGNPGANGTDGTGNGGGGASSSLSSGNGGSGVVIVRYTRSQVGG